MIKPLRKRHLQIWATLAVLLPIGILSAWLVVPKPVREHLLQPASAQALPLLLKNIDKINYSAILRSNADTSVLQLEWINKKPLVVPSALIYQVSDGLKNMQDANIVGRIDVQGTYLFPLKKDPANKNIQFVLYDIVHHKIIYLINF
jgi:hypothetical protein